MASGYSRLPGGHGDEDGESSSSNTQGGGGLSALFARARRRRNEAAEEGDEAAAAAAPLLSSSAPQRHPPLTTTSNRENVDAFLSRLYRFHEEGGFTAVALSRGLNLLAIAFTAAFAATLLLVVKWKALSESQCLKEDTCDISEVALDFRPLRSWLGGKRPDLGIARVAGALLLLAALGCFFVASAAAAVADIKAALESRAVSEEVLGLSERSLRRASWAEVARRLVEAQKEEKRRREGGGGRDRGAGRGVSDDEFDDDLDRTEKQRTLLGPLGSGGAVLDESLIAARIMRRDNYLIALLAEGLLPLAPGAWLLTPEEEQEEEEEEDEEGENSSSKVRRAWRRFAALSRRALRRLPSLSWPLPPSLAAAYEWNLRAVLLEPMFVLSSSEGEEGENDGEESDGGENGGRGRRREEGEPASSPPLVVLSPEATDPIALASRARRFALLNALAAPFALALLVVLLFMRHAERLYHHPSTAAARDWSRLARWRVREFNELPGSLEKRLERSRPAAERYVAGFPSPASAAAAKFVAFVAGSGAALLLLVAVLHDGLLERSLWGRHLVWWIALLGIVLAGSRSWAEGGGGGGSGGGAGSSGVAAGVGHGGGRRRFPVPPSSAAPPRSSSATATGFASSPSFRASSPSSRFCRDDQDALLLEVASHTHFYPRRWRGPGRGGSRATQHEFEQMFPLALTSLLLSEVAALVSVPLMLWRDLPRAAAEICAFVGENTTRIEGVGDACSLSAFQSGGDGGESGGGSAKTKASSSSPAATAGDLSASAALALLSRSREGKLEKSLLSFAAEYPRWRPDERSRALLEEVARRCGRGGGEGKKKEKSDDDGDSGGASSLVGSILLCGEEQDEKGREARERRTRRRDTAFGGSSELEAKEEEDEEEEVEPLPSAASRRAPPFPLLPGDVVDGNALAAAHLSLLASLDLKDDGERERKRNGRSSGRRDAGVARRQQQSAAPPPPPPQQQQTPPAPPPPPPIRFPASRSNAAAAAASPRVVAQWGGFGAFGEEQELASLSPSPASFPSSSSAPAFPLPPPPPPPPPSGALSQQLRAVVASAVPPPVAFDAPLSFSSSAVARAQQQQQQQRQQPPPSLSSSSSAAIPTWPPLSMFGGDNGSGDEEAAGGGGGGGFVGALVGGGGGGGGTGSGAANSNAAAAAMMTWAAMPPDLDEPALDAAADPWGVSRGQQ